ncbi:hypothetical protein LTR33_003678 [Friedmanniomyces endolithicus]|nr:hypothetical protein LTR33_003678 [Friedmanniomyces endolithicus]
MSLSSGSVHESYPRAEDSYVLGLCTGSLAEAAVSASGSLSELLPLAVQAVLISLRLGLCTVAMRDRIETSNEHRSSSRSASVVGMDSAPANAAIEEFCKTKMLPLRGKPWVASLSARSVTVSAPPLVLNELFWAQFRPPEATTNRRQRNRPQLGYFHAARSHSDSRDHQ